MSDLDQTLLTILKHLPLARCEITREVDALIAERARNFIRAQVGLWSVEQLLGLRAQLMEPPVLVAASEVPLPKPETTDATQTPPVKRGPGRPKGYSPGRKTPNGSTGAGSPGLAGGRPPGERTN